MDGVGVDGSPPTSDPENPGGLNQGPGRPLDAPPSYDEVMAEMEAAEAAAEEVCGAALCPLVNEPECRLEEQTVSSL